ncbi:GntR family transcriptional regulator [Haloimpatiens lingqiaonensis]|uniref:GntR family transcriptional regulator n=1 Tax=Haloimpatiens lingqiaonensis TaxID=1380675 RepID=UPI0010FD836F|nr:GntR family transcriptional regulator [Haloimpatiens lingqiaonensis]
MIEINSKSSTPIYEQIINEIKECILKGILKPGDKLPSVRELSTMITANPNTVAKAYKELERSKTIEVIRGKGTFVAENYTPSPTDDKLEELKELMKKIVIEAHYMGLDKNYLSNLLNDIYNEF